MMNPHDMAAHLGGDALRVFLAITDAVNGMTDDDLSQHLAIEHQSVSARRRQLVLLGYVQKSNAMRATRSGKPATVWIVGSGTPEAPRPARPSNAELRSILSALPPDHKTRAWLQSFLQPEESRKVTAAKSAKPRRLSGKAWSAARAAKSTQQNIDSLNEEQRP